MCPWIPTGFPDDDTGHYNSNLEFDNGEIVRNGVTVKVGKYPLFPPSSRYLGLRSYDGDTRSWHLGRGFRVDNEGKLARLNIWDGSIDWFSGPLEGVPLITILERLGVKC